MTKTAHSERLVTDVLIIGGGAAGMRLALALAETCDVLLMYKEDTSKSASWRAQGGIAAVFDADDSLQAHLEDTLLAGAGLCDRNIVEMVVAAAAKEVRGLIELGVDFDSHHGAPELALEGGHSHRRILHVLDHTGKAISKALAERVKQHKRIRIIANAMAIDLINAADLGQCGNRIVGAYSYLNNKNIYLTIGARATVLATGGASKAYLFSNNINAASGDGIAMAWRAGAVIANMEFNQFHPTYLYHAHAEGMLLTEALRGEGAVLRLPNGGTLPRSLTYAGSWHRAI